MINKYTIVLLLFISVKVWSSQEELSNAIIQSIECSDYKELIENVDRLNKNVNVAICLNDFSYLEHSNWEIGITLFFDRRDKVSKVVYSNFIEKTKDNIREADFKNYCIFKSDQEDEEGESQSDFKASLWRVAKLISDTNDPCSITVGQLQGALTTPQGMKKTVESGHQRVASHNWTRLKKNFIWWFLVGTVGVGLRYRNIIGNKVAFAGGIVGIAIMMISSYKTYHKNTHYFNDIKLTIRDQALKAGLEY